MRTEDLLRNQTLDETTIKAACEMLAQEVAPIDDIRSTAQYRLRVAANLLADFLSTLKMGDAPSNFQT
jgi:CO/xanthine dehydrogenase FAD-binding subunit